MHGRKFFFNIGGLVVLLHSCLIFNRRLIVLYLGTRRFQGSHLVKRAGLAGREQYRPNVRERQRIQGGNASIWHLLVAYIYVRILSALTYL